MPGLICRCAAHTFNEMPKYSVSDVTLLFFPSETRATTGVVGVGVGGRAGEREGGSASVTLFSPTEARQLLTVA